MKKYTAARNVFTLLALLGVFNTFFFCSNIQELIVSFTAVCCSAGFAFLLNYKDNKQVMEKTVALGGLVYYSITLRGITHMAFDPQELIVLMAQQGMGLN